MHGFCYFGLDSGEDDVEEEVGNKGEESEVSESEDSETILCVCVGCDWEELAWDCIFDSRIRSLGKIDDIK